MTAASLTFTLSSNKEIAVVDGWNKRSAATVFKSEE
jgi:hypothetical protein